MSELIVAEDQWSQIIFYDQWNSLELKWHSSTSTATDSDLKTTMKAFADEAVGRRPHTLIVDTTDFLHPWGEGVMQWRDATIVPLYNLAGVAKFAFIANRNYPGPTVESGATPGPNGPANFPTAWFESREAAYRWLSS